MGEDAYRDVTPWVPGEVERVSLEGSSTRPDALIGYLDDIVVLHAATSGTGATTRELPISGVIRTFIDNAFQHETTNFQVFDTTSTSTDRFVGPVFFNSYWNGNPTDNTQIPYSGQEIYVDDCTVHIGPSLPPNVDTVNGYPIIGDWTGPEKLL